MTKQATTKKKDATDEAVPATIVKQKYRKAYGKPAHCGDPIALAFLAVRDDADFTLERIAKDNDLTDRLAKWAHLNPGQRRMNLSNVIRALHRKGTKVRIGKTAIAGAPQK